MALIYYLETALKNLKKWHHKGAPVSHLSPNILKIFYDFIVLKQVLSICTSVHNDRLKTGSDIRNLAFEEAFLWYEELYWKFAQFWKFVKDDITNKTQKTCMPLVLDLILTCIFFKKSDLWKVLLLECNTALRTLWAIDSSYK